MFKIALSPHVRQTDDNPPIIAGNVLNYRGQTYDFSPLPEGAEIEIGTPFIGLAKKENGIIFVTLEYHYNMNTSEDFQSTDWGDYTFTIGDGQCPCPIKRKPKPTAFNFPEVKND